MDINKKVESNVRNTLKKIGLNKKEKILVAFSGGKDSTLVGYLLKKFGYNIEGIHINLKIGNYSDKCLNAVKKFCKDNNVKLHVYDVKSEMGAGMCYLRSAIQHRQKGKGLKNCAICGVMKKWILNREARRLKASKIATGHNLDDEAQTFLMNIFKGSPELSANTGIITQNISDKKFVSRIKPLFYVLEDDVRTYTKKKNLPVVYEKCPCALDSYRIQLRKFTDELSEKDKRNILDNFDFVFKKIKGLEQKEMQYCEVCGEPSRNKICRKCLLVKS